MSFSGSPATPHINIFSLYFLLFLIKPAHNLLPAFKGRAIIDATKKYMEGAMTLRGVRKKYEGKYALLEPLKYDGVRPKTFRVLTSCLNPIEAERVCDYYVAEGFKKAFVYSCLPGGALVSPRMAARMFQVVLGN